MQWQGVPVVVGMQCRKHLSAMSAEEAARDEEGDEESVVWREYMRYLRQREGGDGRC